MIAKLSKACQQYNVQELCDLFDHARSSYYYQSKDKPMDSDTKAIIKSMRQIALPKVWAEKAIAGIMQ